MLKSKDMEFLLGKDIYEKAKKEHKTVKRTPIIKKLLLDTPDYENDGYLSLRFNFNQDEIKFSKFLQLLFKDKNECELRCSHFTIAKIVNQNMWNSEWKETALKELNKVLQSNFHAGEVDGRTNLFWDSDSDNSILTVNPELQVPELQPILDDPMGWQCWYADSICKKQMAFMRSLIIPIKIMMECNIFDNDMIVY